VKSFQFFSRTNGLGLLLVLTGSLAGTIPLRGQPTIVSVVPARGATGVSTSAPVVFTFSTNMNFFLTSAQFFDASSPFAPLPTMAVWSAGNTKLTCTPNPAFPANKTIVWSVDGEDEDGTSLGGETSGFFTTGSGGGGGSGSGTNAITTFSVGRVNYYNQTSAGAPFLDREMSYGFTATTTLASNRTASSISLTLPTGAVTNLSENPFSPELFYFFDSGTNLAPFEAQYPGGNYLFNVQAASSNQQATVALPAGAIQPNAPHVSNFAAAQSVDPTQPFTLTWDAFAGGSAADYISVQIQTNFMSANVGSSGALNGTATSIVIPANTLPPNRFLDGCELTFYHYVASTNGSFATFAYRATSTQFFMTTTGGSATNVSIVLTNTARPTNGAFSFDVLSPAGQTVTIEYSTTLKPGSWSTLLSTNNSSGRVRIADPQAGINPYRFYRGRNGP
jgi:hypothetical protein